MDGWCLHLFKSLEGVTGSCSVICTAETAENSRHCQLQLCCRNHSQFWQWECKFAITLDKLTCFHFFNCFCRPRSQKQWSRLIPSMQPFSQKKLDTLTVCRSPISEITALATFLSTMKTARCFTVHVSVCLSKPV